MTTILVIRLPHRVGNRQSDRRWIIEAKGRGSRALLQGSLQQTE